MQKQLFYQGQIVGVQNLLDLQSVPESLFDAFAKEVVGKGVISGLVPVWNVGYGCTLPAGILFSANGKRIESTAPVAVNFGVSENLGATVPIPQSSGSDQERYVSLFGRWTETLVDLTTHPDNTQAYYTSKDGLALRVVAGDIAALGAGVRPALRPDEVLICDVKLTSSNPKADVILLDRTQKILSLIGLSIASAQHTHIIADVTNLQATLDGLTTGLAQKVGPTHDHPMTSIVGLSTALGGKANTSHTHLIADLPSYPTLATLGGAPTIHSHSIAEIANWSTTLANYSLANHTHTLFNLGAAGTNHIHSIGDICKDAMNLGNALASKAALDHGHTQAEVTGLTAALANKAGAVHQHDVTDIPQLANTIASSITGKANVGHQHYATEIVGNRGVAEAETNTSAAARFGMQGLSLPIPSNIPNGAILLLYSITILFNTAGECSTRICYGPGVAGPAKGAQLDGTIATQSVCRAKATQAGQVIPVTGYAVVRSRPAGGAYWADLYIEPDVAMTFINFSLTVIEL